MKAVHYEKPFEVNVKEVPLPKIEHPDDAIIKVTTAGMQFVYPNRASHSLMNLTSYLWLRSPHVPRPNSCRGRTYLR